MEQTYGIVICPKCNGTGLERVKDRYGSYNKRTCSRCKGDKKLVTKEQLEKAENAAQELLFKQYGNLIYIENPSFIAEEEEYLFTLKWQCELTIKEDMFVISITPVGLITLDKNLVAIPDETTSREQVLETIRGVIKKLDERVY